MNRHTPKSIDIFCRVIDNYGDIGVCWRLAKELKYLYPDTRIYLIVDKLNVFTQLEPLIKPNDHAQTLENIVIVRWDFLEQHLPSEMIIEAFGCELPEYYTKLMPLHTKVWINLEYLTHEKWSFDYHLKPSIQSNGMTKYFFFPVAGGLILEELYFSKKDRFLNNPIRIESFISQLLSNHLFEKWVRGAKLISLFAYPNAPVHHLINALSKTQHQWIILYPENTFPELEEFTEPHQQISVQSYPFLSQNEFDCLLQVCEYNFVRGEDSFVRALWAENPFIWQLYPQEDQAQLKKLKAWFEYLPKPNKNLQNLIYYWNTGDERFISCFLDAIQPDNRERWCGLSQKTTSTYCQTPNLIQQLMTFYHDLQN